MTWYYKGQPLLESDTQDFIGFVYQIQNITNGKKYIGKKEFFKTIKRKPLKGKKRKRICKVKSDWETYTGSSNKLNEDITNGHDIHKEIVKLCTSKSSMTYYELMEQLKHNALIKNDYYNEIITVRLRKVCVDNIIKDEYN